MNGGPGASSVVFGFFGELGPYFMDDDSMQNKTTRGVPDLKPNPYAWNSIANVLFLESPANVGYSYCDDPTCRWDDTTGAEANYAALLQFFDQFPEYKDNEFYITGESCALRHAASIDRSSTPEQRLARCCADRDVMRCAVSSDGGMYVPSLVEQVRAVPARVAWVMLADTSTSYAGCSVAVRIRQVHNGKPGAINLKGFAVGNGIIGHADMFPGQSSIHYEMLHSEMRRLLVSIAAHARLCVRSGLFARCLRSLFTLARLAGLLACLLPCRSRFSL